MIERPEAPQALVAPRTWREPPPFTESYRARAVCVREVAQLSNEIARRLRARHAAGDAAEPGVSQSPGRCIVQLGPVALTVTWLRSRLDVVAEGQLMVVVWQGAVGPGTRQVPERINARATASARVLWEDAFVVVAQDEASWRWHSDAAHASDCTTLALVDRCVERLSSASAAQGAHA
jgi:hypothetical protein